jgi:anti-sigma factor ChrR (cupin superfamily)
MKLMMPKTAVCIAATLAALVTPVALADTGSAWLDQQVQSLQRQVGMRNAMADASARFELAHGYTVPEQMVARADDDAFAHELALLNHRISLDDLTPVAMADAASGSDWLDKQMLDLQRQVAVRNAAADTVARFEMAHGYALPEQLATLADDGAFTHEMAMLTETIRLNELK